jgi:hypothetical protein
MDKGLNDRGVGWSGALVRPGSMGTAEGSSSATGADGGGGGGASVEGSGEAKASSLVVVGLLEGVGCHPSHTVCGLQPLTTFY